MNTQTYKICFHTITICTLYPLGNKRKDENMKNKKTEQMVKLAFLIALELVLWMTPLGYVPIGVVRATTMHIPVILAGILLGKTQGAVCGFIFGLTSVITNTVTPTVTSFVFSPFYAVGGVSGNLYS
ncbi:MAG: ECF transporter S component, partial [Erysipelotrichaceae bacterium]|nr:ECF transporter S component [Erysipelotrichaceae bacterium]